jgi:hypothetical protein
MKSYERVNVEISLFLIPALDVEASIHRLDGPRRRTVLQVRIFSKVDTELVTARMLLGHESGKTEKLQ